MYQNGHKNTQKSSRFASQNGIKGAILREQYIGFKVLVMYLSKSFDDAVFLLLNLHT
jgi:hypothetical protein